MKLSLMMRSIIEISAHTKLVLVLVLISSIHQMRKLLLMRVCDLAYGEVPTWQPNLGLFREQLQPPPARPVRLSSYRLARAILFIIIVHQGSADTNASQSCE